MKNPDRGEFWRKVFEESGALEMNSLGMSRLGEDECMGPWGKSLMRKMWCEPS